MAVGIDGITSEMLKCGGDVVTKWMAKIYVKWHGKRGGGCQQTGQKPSLFQFTQGRAGEGRVGAIGVKVC